MDVEDPSSLHPLYQAQLAITSAHATGDARSRKSHESRPEAPTRTDTASIAFTIDCDKCEEEGEDRSYCNVCGENYCDQCWATKKKHQGVHVNPQGHPHEKTHHVAARKIQRCLMPNSSHQDEEHVKDEFTKWFGVMRDQMDDMLFEDFGRFASILAEGSFGSKDPRYPGLVSFVGETSHGKSTIIKLLISLAPKVSQHYESPVVGPPEGGIPTSGDVHLYRDPATFGTQYPILFADCEGLQGGEREPLGARSRHKEKARSDRTPSFQRKLRKLHHSSKRELLWANTPQTRTREYAVTNLYPRLLFTFSDAIVFVSKNSNAVEHIIERLVGWAAAAIETSSNQPILPHLIIVINACPPRLEAEHWEVGTFTEQYLGQIPIAALKQNPKINTYLKWWESRRRPIRSAIDLLESYYMTVRAVRIPSEQRPKMVEAQIGKLSDEIHSACDNSKLRKKSNRMLMSADDLQPYLQSAFDHFAQTLDEPFDWAKAAVNSNSIPNDWGGCITRMAVKIMDVSLPLYVVLTLAL